ncbi:hypothetical protein FKM82_009374 [Ascaphus truei]
MWRGPLPSAIAHCTTVWRFVCNSSKSNQIGGTAALRISTLSFSNTHESIIIIFLKKAAHSPAGYTILMTVNAINTLTIP